MAQKILTKEELSVGNWVIDTSSKRMYPTPCQIQGIYNDTIYWTNPCNPDESSPRDRIEPIEINAQTISKYVPNLIQKENSNIYQYENYKFQLGQNQLEVWDDDVVFGPNKEGITISIRYLELKYIHQLQNFLTLIP